MCKINTDELSCFYIFFRLCKDMCKILKKCNETSKHGAYIGCGIRCNRFLMQSADMTDTSTRVLV